MSGGGGAIRGCIAALVVCATALLVACRPAIDLGAGKRGDGGAQGATCDAGACLPLGCTTTAACDDLCFEPDALRDLLVGGVEPLSAAFYDGNGDGHLDVLVPHLSSEDVHFFAGDGAGGWAVPRVVSVGRSSAWMAFSDFTGDGFGDVFLVQPETRRARLLTGGTDGPTVSVDLAVANDAVQVVPHDADADGDVDLLVSRNNSRCLDVHRNDGTGTFSATAGTCIPFPSGLLFTWAGRPADVDGDGRGEIIGIHASTRRMIAFDADLAAGDLVEVGRWPSGVGIVPVVANVSGDAALELVALPKDGVSSIVVYPARVDATSASCVGATVPKGVDAWGVADVDGDALPDFVGLQAVQNAAVVVRARPSVPFIQ